MITECRKCKNNKKCLNSIPIADLTTTYIWCTCGYSWYVGLTGNFIKGGG